MIHECNRARGITPSLLAHSSSVKTNKQTTNLTRNKTINLTNEQLNKQAIKQPNKSKRTNKESNNQPNNQKQTTNVVLLGKHIKQTRSLSVPCHILSNM